MRGYRRNGIYLGDFEITKREILASVSVIAIMLLIGVLIAGKISDYQLDKNEKYNKAVKIEAQDLFEYGMRTNVGNAFVYGDLIAVDTVTYPEIGGEYMHIPELSMEKHRLTTQPKPTGRGIESVVRNKYVERYHFLDIFFLQKR